jgi:uncharacterized protein
LVYNERTYPGLIALFAELGVPTAKSDMSFSVSLRDSLRRAQLEWSGSNAASLFAQPINALKPRFWGMLADIVRFNRAATALAEESSQAGAMREALMDVSLGDYLQREGYGQAFRDWYLIPMAAAIWSCPAQEMLSYPLATFTRFCHNHGLLQVSNRPQWYTVDGGARQYVERIANASTAAGHAIRLGDAVEQIRPTQSSAGRQWTLTSTSGTAMFDHVVLACHSDQAAQIAAPVAQHPLVRAAAQVRYQPNRAVLHTDEALMPARRKAWASWNFLGASNQAAPGDARPVALTYWLNRLQPLPFKRPILETLNPFTEPRAGTVLAEFTFAHPVFDRAAMAAQQDIAAHQGQDGLWVGGAWTGYGFHEDGLQSGQRIARALAQQLTQAAQVSAAGGASVSGGATAGMADDAAGGAAWKLAA